MALESPDYTVERTIGPVEIRRYEPYVVASTTVEGSLESAGSAGFGILARYIFGGNHRRDGSSEKIAMTSPVLQVPTGNRFVVRFMMPGEYTAESLPAPDDDRITIEELAGQRLAALPYRGRWSEDLHDRSLQQLRRTLAEGGLSTDGEPMWARYDPPWKPWFLRRNEVLLQLAD